MKKILLALLLALLAPFSFGQSYPSPTYKNLTVNGSFTATGLVTTTDLATQAANTVLANVTGATASPTAFAMPSCSAVTNALTWTTSTGFTCNSAINAATLGGATFAAPGPIGSTTPSAGAFTTLSASASASAPTLAQGTNTTGVATTAFVQTAASNPLNPVSVGSSLKPLTTPNSINTTATTTINSPTITVTSATGIAVGMGAYASFTPASCSTPGAAFVNPYVVSVVGTTVTMSCNATATNSTPVAVNFGTTNRWDTNSVITANDIGTQTLKVGGSAGNGVGSITGNTASWLDQISTGQDYRFTSAAQIIAPPGGGYALTIASRASDATGGSAPFPLTSFLNLDSWGATTDYGAENVYLQDNLAAATAGHAQPHIQMEQSVNSLWGSPPAEDPYTVNVVNQTISHRYDCGTGQATTSGMSGCTSAMDIVVNPENFQNGLVIENGAIAVNSGFGNGISFPQSVGLIWYSAASTYSAEISSNTANTLNFQFPVTNGAGIKLDGVLTVSTISPSINSGFGTGPSITTANGTAAFIVHVGTSPGATGVLNMPSGASNGWVCDGVDLSQNNSTQFYMRETATTANSVSFEMFSSSGSSASFVAGDSLAIKCTGY